MKYLKAIGVFVGFILWVNLTLFFINMQDDILQIIGLIIGLGGAIGLVEIVVRTIKKIDNNINGK